MLTRGGCVPEPGVKGGMAFVSPPMGAGAGCPAPPLWAPWMPGKSGVVYLGVHSWLVSVSLSLR